MIDRTLIDTIASTIPDGVDPTDEALVTQHACNVCRALDERPSEIEPHIPDIMRLAVKLKLARAL